MTKERVVGQPSDKSGPWATARHGSITVPIYRVRSRLVWSYVVAWYEGRRRIRRTFSELQEAQAEAGRIARTLAQHGASTRILRGDELLAYRRAEDSLRSLGVPVDVAAAEYADARGKLGDISLAEAVSRFLRSPGASTAVRSPPIADVVEEFIRAKEQAGRSSDHLKSLRVRLRAVTRTFSGGIDTLTVADVERWLGSFAHKPRTRRNYLDTLTSLVRWSERRGYVERGRIDLSGIERGNEETDIEIYTADELRAILAAVRPDFVPFIALGAFAGLRSAEISRLDWSEITAEHVDIRAAKSKTRVRRLVPVLPALSAWVEPHRRDGRVCDLVGVWRIMREASTRSGIPWRRNALRHSFGTYRMAVVRNESQVALEMGNTPAMVFRHYRAIATEAEAKKWFNWRP